MKIKNGLTYEPYTPKPQTFMRDGNIDRGLLYSGNKVGDKTKFYGKEYKDMEEAIFIARRENYTRICVREYEKGRVVRPHKDIILREGI